LEVFFVAGTILYVDDEPQVLRAMSRDLSTWLRARDLRLETVGSGAECLELLQNTSEDVVLVISDLRMPGMKGSELLQRLSRKYPDMGLVLLTAYSDMDDITRAVSAEISGLILKPWDVMRLTAELDRMVKRVERKRKEHHHHHEVESQLQIAGDFQSRFFETPVPTHPGYTIEISNRPAPGIYVTGDYYEVIPLSDERLLVLIGDVSGHGVKPAFVATMLKVIVDEARDDITSPDFRVEEFMMYLNRTLLARLTGVDEVLVAFSAALIDLPRATVRYSGAGNPPLCIIRDGNLQRIPSSHPALGFSADISYSSAEVPIQNRDRVVLFTDGMYDRGSVREVSESVISTILVQADTMAPFVKQVERLLDAVDIFDTAPRQEIRSDDLTLVSVKIQELNGRN
jgi:sigma-B regulation protein RsbU (phosphoserine phosphatase)